MKQRIVFAAALAAAAFLMAVAGPARAAEIVERPDLADAFAVRGTTGVFVDYDLSAERIVVSDQKRAETRFVPASTFKIPNALIALDLGTAKGPDEVFPYDGGKRYFKEWERDLTLTEAMRVSCVPVFQEIARRTGLERMRVRVADLGYGNRQIGTVVDRFWLDGPLAISALEQTDFLARLVRRQLPVAERAVLVTRDLIRQDGGGERTMFAKTGTAVRDGRAVLGWWVGWVEGPAGVHVFALNHDLDGKMESDTRKAIAKDLLTRLHVL
jgi:beta-lactamase class D